MPPVVRTDAEKKQMLGRLAASTGGQLRQGSGDVLVVLKDGREVCYEVDGLDLWKGDDFVKPDATEAEAVEWLRTGRRP
jgi:hypothetical protein